MDLKQHIRSIPDFPKPGILFYDISTLLAHPAAWRATVTRLADALRPHQPDLLIGIESRGFLVAAPVAYELGRGFAMIRKQGKLPGRTVRHSYDLEYGSDTIEIQEDAFTAGQRVVTQCRMAISFRSFARLAGRCSVQSSAPKRRHTWPG